MIIQRCLVPADAEFAGVAGAHKDQKKLPARGTATIAGDGKPGAPVQRMKRLFAETMLENSSTRPPRRLPDFAVSAGLQLLFLAALLLIPLYFTQALDVQQLNKTLLVVPPPAPAPPPLAPARSVAPKARTSAVRATLVVPKVIPNHIAHVRGEPNEEDLAAAIDLGAGAGVAGGVAGGIPGGQLGGVLGGASSGPVRPEAIDSAPKVPVRVGGKVKRPRVLFAPGPVYPLLARQARISGSVVIDAVIDTQGNVVEMQAVSGQPILTMAAMEALRRWKYEPTILGSEPVPVRLLVTITFESHRG
ncbi:MAG TPA: energy transducer TonB [Candidatus Acidoferrum sp.]